MFQNKKISKDTELSLIASDHDQTVQAQTNMKPKNPSNCTFTN